MIAVRAEWDRMERIRIKFRARAVICLWVAFYGVLLAGCSGNGYAPVSERSLGARAYDSRALAVSTVVESDAKEHRVVGGDTLYAIAWRYGKDFRELARFNNIGADYIIYPGQRLTLFPPQASPTASAAVMRAPSASSAIDPQAQNARSSSAQVASGLPNASGAGVVASTAVSTARTATASITATTPSTATTSTTALTSTTTRGSTQTVAVEPATQSRTGGRASAPATSIATSRPSPTPRPQSVNAESVSKAPLVWNWPAKGEILKRFSPRGRLANGLDIAGRRGEPVLAAADGKVVYVGSGILGYGQLIIINHNEAYLSAYAHNSRLLVKEQDAVTLGDKIAEIGHSGTTRSMLHFEIRKDGKPVDPLRYLPKR